MGRAKSSTVPARSNQDDFEELSPVQAKPEGLAVFETSPFYLSRRQYRHEPQAE